MMSMSILPMTRLGLVPFQNLSTLFHRINHYLKHGKVIKQLQGPAYLKTEKFPEGHLFFPGSFLFDEGECEFHDLQTDRIQEGLEDMQAETLRLAKRIAFLNGKNCAAFCCEPFQTFFQAYGVEAEFVTDSDIRDGVLKQCDLLIVPGGPDAGESYYEGLGEKGFQEIAAFIEQGGCYLGSCAGSYFPLTAPKGSFMEKAWLNLISVTDLQGLDYWRTGTGFVRVEVTDSSHPVTYGLAMGMPSTIDMIYWEGPAFHLLDTSKVKVIARYKDFIASGSQPPSWDISMNPIAVEAMKWYNPLTADRFREHLQGKGAIIEAEYGKGRMILLSPHAEFGTCGTSPAMEENPNFMLLMNSLYYLSINWRGGHDTK